MEKSAEPKKKTIKKRNFSKQQHHIEDVLNEMAAGKYQKPTLLGAPVIGEHPYLFDTKGGLAKADKALKRAAKRLQELEEAIKKLGEAGCIDTLNADMRSAARVTSIETAYDLIIENATRAGASHVLFDLSQLLQSEIEKFRAKIASTRKNLPRGKTKLQAAHVAKQIADIYVETLGKRPTAGSIGGQSGSTVYSRAVEDIFRILEIDGNPLEFARRVASQYADEAAKEAQAAKLTKIGMFRL